MDFKKLLKNLESNFIKKRLLFSVFVILGISASFAQQKITGTIKDPNGMLVPGVSVSEKGTTNGVISNFDGKYEINTKNSNATLVFSYIGYVTQEIAVGNKKEINLTFEENLQQLSEVVVIGYGTQKRGEVTSAIATVKAEDFNPGFVRDAADLIKGKVAGLSISNGSGDPSSGANISLRGVSSLKGGTAPLVLINGVPGSLNSVSPDDIESVDVLKDASAAAIYGTRGANGVIIITTKSGKRNTVSQLKYSHYSSMSSFGEKANFLTANDYPALIAQGELSKTGGDLGYKTDWLDEISRTAITQNHNINFSGGSENSTYSVNVNYIDQEGVFKGSQNEEFRVSADVNHYLFDDKLKFNVNIINGIQNTGALGDGNAFNPLIYRQALIRNPTDRIRNDDSTFTQNKNKLQYVNPLGMIKLTDGILQKQWLRITGNVTLTPIDGWENNLMVSTERNSDISGYSEKRAYLGYNGEERNGFASRGTGLSKTKILEFTSKYSKEIDKHSFSVLGGYSHQYYVEESFWANNFDFPTDAFSYNNLSEGRALQDGKARMDSNKNDNTLIGFFGRLSYGFDSRFNVLASFRREGSSKFGNNYKWGDFPSVSAGWTISNESFLKDVDFVNTLKLRAGYGETGVIPNDPYRSLTLLQYGGNFLVDGVWVKGLEAASNPNPDLRWEVSKEVNLGIDFAFAKNRISGSIDVYKKKTEDMLWDYTVPTPPNLYRTTLANVGQMENKGIEVLLNVTPVKSDDFTWEANMTYSHNENKLVSLSNDLYEIEDNVIYTGGLSEPISTGTHKLEVGQSIGNFWGLESVDLTDDGFWLIELPDGSQVPFSTAVENDESRQYLGNGVPKHLLGITNSFKYKDFDLSFVLNGAFGFQILNAQRAFYENPNVEYNMLKSAFDPVYGKGRLNENLPQKFVSYYLENGDYLKLENITLGYNLNCDRWSFIDSVRLYTTATNLLTITGYSGIDPEIRRDDVLAQGNDDRDKYPTVRTFTLGLNVNF
ncbi:SusC/RagA family TonB-linked outer membrane protein [Mariniflexile litorale]|uniref:SusC/RagA family TonB-linked outer membrane protein n=1 Tax=Mariniflexile litorale TaxID=3045158 RepID=A0AAU7EE13_9FLAO|nr:SusC/RagA family TonB-linked outer membrane protein [Mariniflexile sp. KMM 9835]MDQ8212863.1 SusC/RagA family TonB-linked outer membrane protein [Mariniflexile sp. KMM 9835]